MKQELIEKIISFISGYRGINVEKERARLERMTELGVRRAYNKLLPCAAGIWGRKRA